MSVADERALRALDWHNAEPVSCFVMAPCPHVGLVQEPPQLKPLRNDQEAEAEQNTRTHGRSNGARSIALQRRLAGMSAVCATWCLQMPELRPSTRLSQARPCSRSLKCPSAGRSVHCGSTHSINILHFCSPQAIAVNASVPPSA